MTEAETGAAATGDQEWWFCLVHRRAEAPPDVPLTDRMGPYATKVLAQQALETAAQRSQAWDEDPQWNDDPPRDRA